MDRHTQFGLDQSSERSGAGRIFLGEVAVDKLHHLARELVRALGTSKLGKQSAETRAREVRFGLIKRRPRYAEKCGGLRLLDSLDAHLKQHLVLHLHQIASVEESLALKPRRANTLGMAI